MNNLRPGNVSALPQNIERRYFNNPEFDDFIRFGVEDDGSCFFHSISAALNLSNYHQRSQKSKRKIGRNLRRILQRTMTAETWKEFWESRGVQIKSVPNLRTVIKKMKNPSQWSDVYMILYIMDSLGLNIVFFDGQTQKMYCGVRGKSDAKQTVFILWVARSHFEPIFSVDANKKVKTIFNKTDSIVKHVMDIYSTSPCGNVTLHSIL